MARPLKILYQSAFYTLPAGAMTGARFFVNDHDRTRFLGDPACSSRKRQSKAALARILRFT